MIRFFRENRIPVVGVIAPFAFVILRSYQNYSEYSPLQEEALSNED